MADPDIVIKYETFHMVFLDDKFSKGTNVISNDENAEMKGSVHLYKPEASQSSSSESKGHAEKRERSLSLSKSSPEKKRPKTSPSKGSQGDEQLEQRTPDLHAKTPLPSPAVALAPKSTSSQGEKATGSKDTASTASDAIPSTSSGSGSFKAERVMEPITCHSVASFLKNKSCKDRCAFGSKILKGRVAWQVNTHIKLIREASEQEPLCAVGLWTEEKAPAFSTENKVFTLNILSGKDNVLCIKPEWPKLSTSYDFCHKKEIEIDKFVIVKIAFAWNLCNNTVSICIAGEEKVELLRNIPLIDFNGRKICPIFLLGDAVINKEAVVTLNFMVGDEVDSTLKSCIENWTP